MYCTLEDIKKIIPEETVVQLTDVADLGVIDAEKVAEAIASADAIIDGYCAGRYLLPFAVVPAIVKPIAIDLTVYNLYAIRVETMPDVREKNRANAIRLLEHIAAGKVRLGDAAGVEAPVSTQQSPTVTSNERLFSRNSMKGL